jgi:hypothetical protein
MESASHAQALIDILRSAAREHRSPEARAAIQRLISARAAAELAERVAAELAEAAPETMEPPGRSSDGA